MINPKVTVFIPVYNKSEYVKEAVESILNQTYKEFELLIIDDCSTDDTLDKIRSFTDDRIRIYVNQKNLGPGGSSNLAFELARGEYILRLDADDIAPPDRIESQVQYMDSNPHVGVSSGYIKCFGTDENLWTLPLDDKYIKSSFLFTVPICQGASIIRKSVLTESGIKYGDVSNYIGEDRVLWFRLRKVTTFGNINKIVLFYRRGEQNITHDSRFNRIEIRKRIYRFFFNELGIDASDEELDIHTFCEKIYEEGLTKENVLRFRNWIVKLHQINTKRNLFSSDIFDSHLENCWNQLFYRLVSHKPYLVPYFWKLSGKIDFNQITFLCKYLLKKMIRWS